MTDDLIINIRKRGTSSCLEPDTRLEVVDGARILIALERIADALEGTQTQPAQEGYTAHVLNYCPMCGSELQTTTVNIGVNPNSTLEGYAMEIQTIKYCPCGFVKNVGVK